MLSLTSDGLLLLVCHPLYLILYCVGPKDSLQLVMKVHTNSNSSVLGLDQGLSAVSVDISDQQVSPVGEYKRRHPSWRLPNKVN